MNIRVLRNGDIELIKRIHEQHFSAEYKFDEFLSGLVQAFAIEDDSGRIITCGGVRPIMEAIAITDMNFSVRARSMALFKLLEGLIFVTQKSGHSQLHVFIQNEQWERILKHVGFQPTTGKSLVYDAGS